jgi:hypothetical protein
MTSRMFKIMFSVYRFGHSTRRIPQTPLRKEDSAVGIQKLEETHAEWL